MKENKLIPWIGDKIQMCLTKFIKKSRKGEIKRKN